MKETSYLKNILSNYQKPVFGISVTAWTRTGPAFLLPNYHIICLLKTQDLEAIKKQCGVVCLEEKINLKEIKKQNTSSIMRHPWMKKFLDSLGREASLLVYKSGKKTEKICRQRKIKILASPAKVRDPFEDKKEFRVLGKEAGLNLIPGETLLIDQLTEQKFKQMTKKYGPKLVFQLTDFKVGGGIGTLFINCRQDWQDFLGFVARRRQKGKKLIWVNVNKFIEGVAASISACITRYGILTGLLQTQLTDIAEATAFKGRSGVWCGHDWGWKNFNFHLQQKAEKIAQRLGTFMQKRGYKGVFGIDLVVDEKNNQVWPVECNSRYTGAFPLYSMMQTAYGEPCFDIFHLLEFLDLDYKIDFKKIQQLYRQPKTASHLVLHNQTRKWVKVEGRIKGGVWRLEKGKLVWQRPGFCLQDIKDKEEFCLVDRAPIKGRILKPGERLVRILFKTNIALSCHKINDWASEVCRKVMQGYNLRVIGKDEI